MEEKSDEEAIEYGINLIGKKTDPDSDVAFCRSAGADVVIACISWGEMFEEKLNDEQQEMAKTLAKAGADVIIGYNPHVIIPATWIEGENGHQALLLGAPGNLLSDSVEESDTGIIFQFTIQEKEDFSGFEITEPGYVPTYVWRTTYDDGSYDYRSIAVGQYLETAPEGMSYAQHSRLKEVWAQVQSTMGNDIATVIAK